MPNLVTHPKNYLEYNCVAFSPVKYENNKMPELQLHSNDEFIITSSFVTNVLKFRFITHL